MCDGSFAFDDPLDDQPHVLGSHDPERQNTVEHGLFEKHEIELGQIAPVGIVIQINLQRLQKRRERNPCGQRMDIPWHHFEGPGEPRKHDRQHPHKAGRRHCNRQRQDEMKIGIEQLREHNEDDERTHRHQRCCLQNDIDARQSPLIKDTAADDGHQKNGTQASQIIPASADDVFFNCIRKRHLECRRSHENHEQAEIKEQKDWEQIIGITGERIERAIDVEIDRLKCPHELEIRQTSFLQRDHSNTDRCRFDHGLNGLVGVFGDQNVGSIDIGNDVSTRLCFNCNRQSAWNVHDCGSLTTFEHVPGLFGGIQRTQHFQILTGSQKSAHHAADGTVIVIDDVNRDFCDNAGIIQRGQQKTCADNQHDHHKEFRPSEYYC